jgi:RimJ/RimL family protein N-acetyltransferase
MQRPAITLRPFTTADLATVTPWFDDPDTRRYLGGPDWPRQMLTLAQTQVGAMFRGARQTAAHRWLAERDGLAVGYLDCGTFDRWTTCTQTPDQRVVVIDTIDRPSASICYTVAPQHRHHGIAQAMIRTMLADPALDHIRIIGAGIEPANIALVRTLLAAGFRPHTEEPDWEDIIYFLLDRDSPTTAPNAADVVS